MSNCEQSNRLEIRTIQPIARDQRHGKARDLFTVWFGSNVQLLAIVTGGLAVTTFGLSFVWATVGLALGNFVGGVFMALHAAQGPTLGVPQMVQTRGQFGSIGSLLVIGIVIIMYIGFLASNTVLGGEALASLAPGLTDTPGIIVVGVLGVVATIYGHDLIHAYTRVMSYVAGAVLLLTVVWIVWVHGLPPDFLTRNALNTTGLIGTISAAALWQISYAPYVSDYTRYMPADTGAVPAFWASYWGCTLGSLLPMILGAAVGIAAPQGGGLVHGLALLTAGISPLVLIVFSVGIAASNALNLYCGSLSTLTFGQTLFPAWSPGPKARVVVALLLFGMALAGAILSKDSFLANYEEFILLLLYVLVPWTAINLVDYYLLQHGRYDVDSFFRQDGGIYGRVNGAAVTCYVLGTAVQLPFVASALYTGPIARAIGGIDVSWMVGLAVTSPAYYWLGKRSQARRAGALLASAG
ncbi:MAG: cytosine permease [Pseudomonadota bacterium]|nr:cytosine permease [Pseudomonadota bacterium]